MMSSTFFVTYAEKLEVLICGLCRDRVHYILRRHNEEGNLYVLRHSNMPAILVELGFISNPNEERALKSDQTEQDFANRIAVGIANYFGG